jgi:hypothetical protein
VEFPAGEDILVPQKVRPKRLPGLPHPDLHTSIVYEAVLAANEVILEKASVFTNLFTSLNLSLCKVAHVKRIEFTTVRPNNPRAIA